MVLHPLFLFGLLGAAKGEQGPKGRLARLENRLGVPAAAVPESVAPKDGQLVYIFNTKFPGSRLGDWGSGCGFWDGHTTDDVHTDQLWEMGESKATKGEFFLKNFDHPEHRYAFNPQAGGSYCWSGDTMYNDQLWTFTTLDEGETYLIDNFDHAGCRMTNWGDGNGGVGCTPTREDNQYFKLIPAFVSTAEWVTVSNLSSGDPINSVQLKQGFEAGIVNTVAMNSAAMISLQTSIEMAVGKVGGVTVDQEIDLGQSFFEAYSNAVVNQIWTTQKTVDVAVEPNTTSCLKQLQVTNVDYHNQQSFVFYTSATMVATDDECATPAKKMVHRKVVE